MKNTAFRLVPLKNQPIKNLDNTPDRGTNSQ